MGAINYSRGGWVMQHSRQKCWDEGPCALRGGVGGLCGGPGEAGRGARRHRGRFSREARAHSPPSRPPLRWGIPGARGAGCLFPGRPERLAGHSWRARSGLSLSWETRTTGRAFLAREERALPKARVLLPYPRRGGQGSGQAQTRGRVLLRPRLPRHARRRRAGLRVLQAMEEAHWPPATDALAIVHTAGLLTHTILTRPTEETRPSAPLCGIRPRLGHLARPCAT